MARQKGSANLAASLEVLAGAPLDARTVVNQKSDLTAAGSFPYFYLGMQVTVKAEFKTYMLIGNDPTVSANWKVCESEQVQADWEQDTDSAPDYIKNKPTLGTAAGMNVPASGDAGNNEVVKGDDSRLTDDRNAADVYDWAKSAVKPVYSAAEVGAIPTTDKGANSGVAELDANGKVPSAQLPSFVDDVVEGYYKAADDRFYEESTYETLITPTEGKSWVDVSTNKSYRWTGSVYVRVDEGVQLGETSDTAYRGDRGKTAYDDSQANKANIGTMSSLETTEKTTLVGAINEVKNAVPDVSGKENTFRYTTMPTAAAGLAGKVVQYIGTSITNSYQHNFFYECVENSGSYSWVQVDVQPDSAGHIIKDAAGTQMPQRSTLKINGGTVTDNQAGDETVIDLAGNVVTKIAALPTASQSEVGHIYLYTGATDVYTHGYMYECVADLTTDPATYSWVELNSLVMTSDEIDDIIEDAAETAFEEYYSDEEEQTGGGA